MKRVLATLHILGLTMVMFALTMLIPLVVAYVGGDAARDAFLHGFLISIGIGAVLAAQRGVRAASCGPATVSCWCRRCGQGCRCWPPSRF